MSTRAHKRQRTSNGSLGSFELFVLDVVPMPIALLEDGIITFINKSLEEKSARAYDEICGNSEFVFLPPKHREGFSSNIRKSIEQSITVAQRLYFDNKNGEENHFIAQIFPFNSSQVCCIFLDSSMDHERLKWLNVIDEHYGVNAIIFEYVEQEEDMIHLFVSKGVRESAKLSKDGIGKKMVAEQGFQKSDVIEWMVPSRQAVETKQPVVIDKLFTLPNGQVKNILSEHHYIGNGPYGPRILHMGRDVTQIRNLEKEIEKKKADLQETVKRADLLMWFFDSVPVAMGVLEKKDDDTYLTFGNKASWQYIARERTDFIKVSEVMPKIAAKGHFSECELRGELEFEIALPVPGKLAVHNINASENDQKRDLTHFKVIMKHTGDHKFMYLCTDVTNFKQLESQLKNYTNELETLVQARTQQLEHALQIKSRFLANMSHDIRTPLSGLMATIQLLNESELNAEQSSLVSTASTCSEQLLVLVNDILDFTKLEENKLTLECAPLNVHRVMEDALEVVSATAYGKDLELVCEFDPGLHEFSQGDETRLRQILVNLLSNAIKFSFKGEILVSAKSEDIANNKVKYTFFVQDQGIGIPPSAQSSLFEAFTQADTSITRKFGGSGLGLNICKQLVGLMGGEIWFDTKEGEGSTFYFTITGEKSPPPEGQELLLSKCPIPNHESKSILVVSDLPKTSNVLKKMLQYWNMMPVMVEHPFEAAQVREQQSSMQSAGAQDTKFIAVLVDAKFGVEVIQRMKKSHPRVIVMGFSRIKQLGDTPFLKKPLRMGTSPNSLYATLMSVCPEYSNTTSSKVNAPRQKTADPPRVIKILVAEDNPMNQIVIQKLLSNLGYKDVVIVDNGVMALDALKKSDYDVVLMDIQMPEMDGLEASDRIRKEFPADKQPIIIAVSANAFVEDKNKCIAVGMNAVVTKPINRDLLSRYLARCANRLPLDQ